jgi:SAM-dependent methyltransferase
MTSAQLDADLYALTHRGTPGDTAFYTRVCAGAERVLELGSGYGRLLKALARSGRALVGLDRDRALQAAAKHGLQALPLAKRRSVQLVHGDMRHFELGSGFDRVLLPYNGLYCLLTKRDALACFRAARAALVPGGLFAFDVWNAHSFQREPIARTGTDGTTPIVTLRHAGRTWDVFEDTRVRRAAQRLLVTYHYLPREGGAVRVIPLAQRYYLAPELSELLGRAGFELVQRFGDFSGARFTARSPLLVVVARAV